MNHLGFIAGAYGVTALVLAVLVAWLAVDGRRISSRLDALAARGVRRRSEGVGR